MTPEITEAELKRMERCPRRRPDVKRLIEALRACYAARAKVAPTIIGMLDENGDVMTTEAMLAVLKREGWRQIPKGWRPVPEGPTGEWIKTLSEQEGLLQHYAEQHIGSVLAAAPEPPE